MKKIVSLLLTLVLCFSMLLTLTSCFFKHPIENFAEKMAKANNYQISITLSDVPLLGTFTITEKVDGNITYTPAVLFDGECYTETVGNVVYTYTQNEDGTWTKSQSETDDSSSVWSDDNMNDLFNPDNFEKVKGEKNTYKQKAGVVFDTMDDVVIVVTDESCTINMSMVVDGLTCGVKIVISKLGAIDLTLPTVK